MVVGPSYIKMIFREFKKSFGRFAAVFGIVALGVGFLSGLVITTPNMNKSVDQYYDKYNTADIFIKASMGLTEDDLMEVGAQENIKSIMPAYVIDQVVDINNKESVTAKIYGLPLVSSKDESFINQLELLEGRMPQSNRECLVERSGPFFKNIKIGSTLEISKDNKDYEDIDDIYSIKSYKVVGIVGNPFHFSMEREISNIGSGKLESIIYIDSSAYALEEFTDFYIVLDDALEMDSFSSQYQSYTEKTRIALERLGKRMSVRRKEEIKSLADEEIEKALEEYEEEKRKAYAKLGDARWEIDKAQRDLKAAKMDIEEGKKELEDARKTLDQEVKEGEKKIQDGEVELKEARLDLVDGEEELRIAKLDLEEGEKEYQEGLKEYRDGLRGYEDGKRQLEDGKKTVAISEEELEEGKKQLAAGKSELREAKRELEKGESQYKAALAEFKAGRSTFLSSLSPLAKELAYSSVERLISTSKGQSDLKNYLIQSKTMIASAISQTEAGISQLETLIIQKNELQAQLEGLTLKLQFLQGQLEENKEAPEEVKAPIIEEIRITEVYIGEINAGLAQIDEKAPRPEEELAKLKLLLPQLKEEEAKIPDFAVLINAWNEILRGEKQLEKAKDELEQGWKDYDSGSRRLRESEEEIRNVEMKIQEAKLEIKSNERLLADASRELKEALEKLESAKKELDQGKKDYQSGLLDLQEGWKSYEDGIVEIRDAKISLEYEVKKAKKKIEDGQKDIEEGIQDYQKGLKEVSKAEVDYREGKLEVEGELKEAYDKILEAKREIRDMEDPEWYVLDRDSNISYVSFELNSDKVAAISTVFPIFFYLIAGLVALTTMTRMVEEERGQIGILKALGYEKSTIISKYLLYSGLASVLGSVVGQLVGFKVLPRLIWNAYGVMYHLPEFVTSFNKQIALLSSGIAVASTVGATFFAANGALKEKPSLLMLPSAPKKGKRILLERITPLWSAMSFNWKSTARNIFRYKKHFYMTVIGISGCTALLLTGFGLRDSIKDLGRLQFSEILQYQLLIQLEEDYSQVNLDKIYKDYPQIESVLELFTDKGHLSFGDESYEINLVAVDQKDDLSQYIQFRDRKSQEEIPFHKDKILVSEKIAEALGLDVGDWIYYKNSDDISKKLQVDGITENYIQNYIYMDRENYGDLFDKKPKNNSLYVKTMDLDSSEEDKLIEGLYKNDDVLNTEFLSQSRGIFDNLISSINYIVILIIVASGLLAFIVLYNLTNININERRRELATLKVLGFYDSEVAMYIFREVTLLTIIASLTGLIVGRFLHQFIIITIEDAKYMFGRSISPSSYMISLILTIIFSLIVDFFMVKKLKNIKMVDSMKAND